MLSMLVLHGKFTKIKEPETSKAHALNSGFIHIKGNATISSNWSIEIYICGDPQSYPQKCFMFCHFMVISQTTNMHLILHNSDWLHVFYYLHQIQSTHRVINFNYKLYQPSSPICLCFYKERNIMPYRKNNQFSSTSCKSNSRNTRYWSIYNIWYFFQKLFIKWIVSHVHGFSTLNRFYL